ncbi:CD63 antigen-like [Aethina tumida]|uniref:CD63 antigen-like n=1 Tax=Aethina tumida TaxID=116153 RepID=UPI00096ADBCD|nr:CD63 antigen-like [Aethina tumida]
METCGMSFIKYLLFIFNLIFAISGIGLIIAGAVVLSDVADFNHFADNELLGPPIVLIVAGAIVFIVAFLGCFGAIRESYNLLMAFAVLLLIIFIIELACGIASAVYQTDFQDTFKNTLKQSMANYSENDVEKIAWDNVHKKFKCCGVSGISDWQGQRLPLSCCHSNHEIKGQVSDYCQNNGAGSFVHSVGCFDKLEMKIHSNTKVVIGVGIGIAFIEIIGIILACWLAYTIKKEGGDK